MDNQDHVLLDEDFLLPAAPNSSGTVGALGVISTGTPTGAAVVTPGSTGEVSFTLANTNEAERTGFSLLDKLVFDESKVRFIDCWLKISATLSSVEAFVFGLTGAGNADFTALVGAMLTIDGGSTPNKLNCRTKNSTLTVNQQSTFTLGTSMVRLSIDLQDRRDVKFYAGSEADGSYRRLLPNPTAKFNFNDYSGGLQPYAHLYKASGTTTTSFTVDRVRVRGIR
mgnify:CR=1 FL=1